VDYLQIREYLLEIFAGTRNSDFSYQYDSDISALARMLRKDNQTFDEHAILDVWHDLFRSGFIAVGHNIRNPKLPWYHVTEKGNRSLEKVTRDPANPLGYMNHLKKRYELTPIAESYIQEAVDCYADGRFKASAVLVGAASEDSLLNLRDLTVETLERLGQNAPNGLKGWRAKKVTDALTEIYAGYGTSMNMSLKESFDAYWSPFIHQIRISRNDAGHPKSIQPITEESVHASLLIFPDLISLITELGRWVKSEFSINAG